MHDEVITFNGSGKPQCMGALAALTSQRKTVAAVLLQEHHAQAGEVADLQAGAEASGWTTAVTAATQGSGGGASAGAAVAVPAHRQWGCPQNQRWDFSPKGSPGRITAMWVRACTTVGLLIISVYGWDKEGMSPRNIALLEAALALAHSFGCPWLIGGDLNVCPDELMAAAWRLLERAGAVVRAPPRPTHYPGKGEARVLDFFLVDSRIDSAVLGVDINEVVAGKPHRAVSIRLRRGACGGLVQTIRPPRAVPRERPIGCPRQPVEPPGGDGGG